MADLPLIISVESRKGGIGKTSVALNLATKLREHDYHVLFLDLDLTGTSVSEIIPSYLWKERCANLCVDSACVDPAFPELLLTYRQKKDGNGQQNKFANLYDLYYDYCQANITPCFELGKMEIPPVYVIGSSYAYRPGPNETSPTCKVPDVPIETILDEMHVVWLIDFVKEMTKHFRDAVPKSGKVAVIIDNSPGYTSVTHQLHEWITDLSPKNGKVVTVTSLEVQDFSVCADSVQHIHRMRQDKEATARKYKEIKKQDESEDIAPILVNELSPFFLRLIEQDRLNAAKGEQPGELDFYLIDLVKETSETSPLILPPGSDASTTEETGIKDYQAVVINRVPWMIKDYFIHGDDFESHARKEKKKLDDLLKNDDRFDSLKNLLADSKVSSTEYARYMVSVSDDLPFADLASNISAEAELPKEPNEPVENAVSMIKEMRRVLIRQTNTEFIKALQDLENIEVSVFKEFPDLDDKDKTKVYLIDRLLNQIQGLIFFSEEEFIRSRPFDRKLLKKHSPTSLFMPPEGTWRWEGVVGIHAREFPGYFKIFPSENAAPKEIFHRSAILAFIQGFFSSPDESLSEPSRLTNNLVLVLGLAHIVFYLHTLEAETTEKDIVHKYFSPLGKHYREFASHVSFSAGPTTLKLLFDKADPCSLLRERYQNPDKYEMEEKRRFEILRLLLRFLDLPQDMNFYLFLLQGLLVDCGFKNDAFESVADEVIIKKTERRGKYFEEKHFDRVTPKAAREFLDTLDLILKSWNIGKSVK